jgi:hypothetical protein
MPLYLAPSFGRGHPRSRVAGNHVNQSNFIVSEYSIVSRQSSVLKGVLMAKNPFNQRNPRLMNYLRAYKALFLLIFLLSFVHFVPFRG